MRVVAFTLLALLGLAIVLIGIAATSVWFKFLVPPDTQITDTLARERQYDPAKKFTFDRVCVIQPEAGVPSDILEKKYQALDSYVGTGNIEWSLVLINDKDRTYRRLWVAGGVVAFDGQAICVPKLTLVVEETPAGLVAHPRW